MAALDLRPLSLGELLDRTFFLYRRNFLLFFGLAVIPYVVLMVLGLVFVLVAAVGGGISVMNPGAIHPTVPMIGAIGSGIFVMVLVSVVVFLMSSGATVLAVSEIYAGRRATIRNSFRLLRGKIFTICVVALLSLIIFLLGSVPLIIPGIYLACRICVAIAAALIEDTGPFASIRRSFALTADYAGRAFMIYLLSVVIAWGVSFVFKFPFMVLAAMNLKQPQLVVLWAVLLQVGNLVGTVVVAPVSSIGFALYYYDLRVRKEALDLQMMMQAIGGKPEPPAITGGVPSMFGRDAT